MTVSSSALIAVAAAAGDSLLFVGDDFRHTDAVPA